MSDQPKTMSVGCAIEEIRYLWYEEEDIPAQMDRAINNLIAAVRAECKAVNPCERKCIDFCNAYEQGRADERARVLAEFLKLANQWQNTFPGRKLFDLIQSIEIPAPPPGFVYQPRIPAKGEEYAVFDTRDWSVEKEAGCGRESYHTCLAYAFRVKTKRLMTPAELAGKWIHFKEGSSFFVHFYDNHGYVGWGAKGAFTPENLHKTGALWFDTPTSERRSLEVEE